MERLKLDLVLVCALSLVVGLAQCENVLQHYNRYAFDISRHCEDSRYTLGRPLVGMYQKLLFWCMRTPFGCPKVSELSRLNDLRVLLKVKGDKIAMETLLSHKRVVCSVHLENLQYYKDNLVRLNTLIDDNNIDFNYEEEYGGLSETKELRTLLAKNLLKLYRDYTRTLDENCDLNSSPDADLLLRMLLRVDKWCTETSYACPKRAQIEPSLTELKHHMWKTYGVMEKNDLLRFKRSICQIHFTNSRKYNSYLKPENVGVLPVEMKQ